MEGCHLTGPRGTAEQIAEGAFEIGVPEAVAGLLEPRRQHPGAGEHRDIGHLAEGQPERHRGDRKQCGPIEHLTQHGGEGCG